MQGCFSCSCVDRREAYIMHIQYKEIVRILLTKKESVFTVVITLLKVNDRI